MHNGANPPVTTSISLKYSGAFVLNISICLSFIIILQRIQNVFRTFSERFQNVFRTHSERFQMGVMTYPGAYLLCVCFVLIAWIRDGALCLDC